MERRCVACPIEAAAKGSRLERGERTLDAAAQLPLQRPREIQPQGRRARVLQLGQLAPDSGPEQVAARGDDLAPA